MLKLVTICLGTAFLMYLSGIYYPTEVQRTGHISRSAQRPGTDIFMAVAIFWLTCFMFLRTSYNDSLLSSKLQKNMSEKWLLFKKATFSDCIEGSFL